MRFTAREEEIVALLLQGCENDDIARDLGMAQRTVKAHFNRMFNRHEITGGVKRVQLAVMVARERGIEASGERLRLRPKQRRIVELVAEGLKNREIGERIGTSQHMVKNYLRVLYDECGVWNRTELALWWITHARTGERNGDASTARYAAAAAAHA